MEAITSKIKQKIDEQFNRKRTLSEDEESIQNWKKLNIYIYISNP